MVSWDKAGGAFSPPVLALLALSIAGSALFAGAGANLAPSAPQEGILFHVQPVSEEFCSQHTMWECSQLRQYTEAKGVLEFDLFVYTKRPLDEISISALNVPLKWPADWQLISWECCAGGLGEMTHHRNMAELNITWPTQPVFEGRLMLAARFIMDAPACGWFGMSGLSGGPVLKLSCRESDEEVWWAMPGWAQAGVECSYCYVPCDLLTPCRAEMSPQKVELEAVSGNEALGWISARSGRRCSPAFTCESPWLSLEVGEPVASDDGKHYDILIRASSLDLPEGVYETTIHGRDDCLECIPVTFTVLPPPPSGMETSWGAVKSLFR